MGCFYFWIELLGESNARLSEAREAVARPRPAVAGRESRPTPLTRSNEKARRTVLRHFSD